MAKHYVKMADVARWLNDPVYWELYDYEIDGTDFDKFFDQFSCDDNGAYTALEPEATLNMRKTDLYLVNSTEDSFSLMKELNRWLKKQQTTMVAVEIPREREHEFILECEKAFPWVKVH